jgi:hypothetical protein
MAAISIHGWGPSGGNEIIDACLRSTLGDIDHFQLFSVLGASQQALIDTLQQSASSLVWDWIVLIRDTSPLTVAVGVQTCAEARFEELTVDVLAKAVQRQIRVASSCGGRHWEWNGDPKGEGCGCIGGYEEVNTVAYGRHCIPCPNGTYRPRYSEAGCVPCSAELFEEGAYLGMSECACVRGYARDSRTRFCQPENLGVSLLSSSNQRIGVFLSTHATLLLLLSIGSGAAALMFAAVLACAF